VTDWSPDGVKARGRCRLGPGAFALRLVAVLALATAAASIAVRAAAAADGDVGNCGASHNAEGTYGSTSGNEVYLDAPGLGSCDWLRFAFHTDSGCTTQYVELRGYWPSDSTALQGRVLSSEPLASTGGTGDTWQGFRLLGVQRIQIKLACEAAAPIAYRLDWYGWRERPAAVVSPVPVAVSNFPAAAPVSGTVALDAEAMSRLDLSWYGIWLLGGLTIVALFASQFHAAFRWWRSS
jgi:hypothetical protein